MILITLRWRYLETVLTPYCISLFVGTAMRCKLFLLRETASYFPLEKIKFIFLYWGAWDLLRKIHSTGISRVYCGQETDAQIAIATNVEEVFPCNTMQR